MALSCKELITELNTILMDKEYLDQAIGRFRLSENVNLTKKEANAELHKIYKLRKKIKRGFASVEVLRILGRDTLLFDEDFDLIFEHIIDKNSNRDPLNREELIFLYDLPQRENNDDDFLWQNLMILRRGRDKNEDILKIFELQPEQLVHNEQEYLEAVAKGVEVKFYCGELFPNFFEIIPSSLEHIYTEFPEQKIIFKSIRLGGFKDKADLEKAMEDKFSQKLHAGIKSMIDSESFEISPEEKEGELVILSLASLGLRDLRYSFESLKIGADVILDKIIERARVFGLDECPAEIGPQLSLQYPEQSPDNRCAIAMRPIKIMVGSIQYNTPEEKDAAFCINFSDRRMDLTSGKIERDRKPWMYPMHISLDLLTNKNRHFAFIRKSRNAS